MSFSSLSPELVGSIADQIDNIELGEFRRAGLQTARRFPSAPEGNGPRFYIDLQGDPVRLITALSALNGGSIYDYEEYRSRTDDPNPIKFEILDSKTYLRIKGILTQRQSKVKLYIKYNTLSETDLYRKIGNVVYSRNYRLDLNAGDKLYLLRDLRAKYETLRRLHPLTADREVVLATNRGAQRVDYLVSLRMLQLLILIVIWFYFKVPGNMSMEQGMRFLRDLAAAEW